MPSLRALALLLTLSWPSLVFCQEYAPPTPDKPAWGIVEEYDEIVLVHIREKHIWKGRERQPYIYESIRVYFGRNGKIIADRYWREGMQYSQVDGKWIIFWTDGSWPDIDRVIISKSLSELHFERTVRNGDGSTSMEWWNQGQRMTDLESPPE